MWCKMRSRKIPLGDKNAVGANIMAIRKSRHIKQKDLIARMQAMGIDINPTSFSKLEGQLRMVSDKELFVIAQIFNIKIDDLFMKQSICLKQKEG